MKLLVVNGPNLNMLGIREPEIYGNKTYEDLENYIFDLCSDSNIECEIFQSNCEGEIVDEIQNAYGQVDAIVINAAAYSHTSIAIMDAIKAVGIKTVEVHLSDVNLREDFRKKSYVALACEKTFMGKGFESYKKAIEYLANTK